MRSGDVRWVWLLLALAAACERRPSRRAPPPAITDAPAAGMTVAPASQGTPVPGCQTAWWPLADGQRWRWSIERRWLDVASAEVRRVVRIVDADVRSADERAARFTIAGWPAPWTEALARPIAVEVEGTRVRKDGKPWLDLDEDARADGVDRRVTAAAVGRPAELELVWRTVADDLTVRLVCGVGPVLVEYHHHGTTEDVRAVRLDDDQ